MAIKSVPLPGPTDEGESPLPVPLGPRLRPELDGWSLAIELALESHGHREDGHLGQALVVQLVIAVQTKDNMGYRFESLKA